MKTKLIGIIACVFLLSCGSSEAPDDGIVIVEPIDNSHTTPPMAGQRDWLTHEELHALNLSRKSAYRNRYFMPIGEVEPAAHAF